MLTKELLKDHFYTAYFIDNNRENIEVLYTNEEKDKMFTCIIPFNKEHGQYKLLNEFISLDELHENTYQKKQDERAHFEKTVMGIAKKEGMVFDEHKLDSKFLNSFSSKINFIVPFVKLFLEMKISSTLQITSTIAFPIPRIFMLGFFSF